MCTCKPKLTTFFTHFFQAVYDEIMYQNPAYFTAQEPESINQTIINGNHSVDVQKILEQYYKKSPFKKKEQSNTPVAQPQQQQQTKQFTPRKPQQPVPIQPSVAPLRPLISSFDPRRIPLFKTMPTFANLNALFINNVIREMHTAEPKLEPIKEEHITVDDYEQWTAEEALNRYIQNCESMKEIFSPIFEQEDEEKLFEERMRRLNAISVRNVERSLTYHNQEKIEELASEPVCKKIKLENDEMSTNGNVLAEKTFEKLLKESSSSMKEIVKKGFKRPTENVEFYKL